MASATAENGKQPLRLAIVVTHPIQYHSPLYRELAARDDVELKVFYTAHLGGVQKDVGFGQSVQWDIPLLEGYAYEAVPNVAKDPGSHHFWGVQNRKLSALIMGFKPDVVMVVGYAYYSHMKLLRTLSRQGVPVLFRGDSHLLGQRPWWKNTLRSIVLSRLFRYPSGFLYVGQHNRDYFRSFGVSESKLFYCPYSIEVDRFAEPNQKYEAAAQAWRAELGIGADQPVLLFAGKFQWQKCPLDMMRAFARFAPPRAILLMVGNGPLGSEVQAIAEAEPERFRVLPFQNQSKMPVTYRLGDAFVLASQSETWGLAVNEALACGRPVLVSDQVGCAPDLVKSGETGEVFSAGDWAAFGQACSRVLLDASRYKQHIQTHLREVTPSTQTTANSIVCASREVVQSNLDRRSSRS